MKKTIKIVVLLNFIFLLIGCTNTETPTRERTPAEKTAYLIDFLLVNAVYQGANFGYAEEIVKSTSKTDTDSFSTTSITNEGSITNTVTKSKTKTKSKGFGYGIGY